jgi:hypothetical protein
MDGVGSEIEIRFQQGAKDKAESIYCQVDFCLTVYRYSVVVSRLDT